VLAKRTRIEGEIFISHPHWDHINALPFFGPLYVQGNQFEICGCAHGGVGMRELISAQMDGVYFPVTVREFSANLTYRDLAEARSRSQARGSRPCCSAIRATVSAIGSSMAAGRSAT
jgi:phosphoribosyl 1,2-cyclic phosphodiesterase